MAVDMKQAMAGALPPGTKIGKYVILERIGAGGQSIVYKAHDPVLDRFVAIKQIPAPASSDAAFIRRYREVAQQVAKLGSEHVVTLLDMLEEPSGMFVVMEFVDGQSLESMLTPGKPIETKSALQIIWRIAAGLSSIHRAGIIHRDIKPGNILITKDLRVKITDFGVAARTGSAASMKLGTTKYMAPELFSTAQVDGQSDIYSLGIISYEMLCGRSKFNEIFQDIVRDPHSEALRWMKWHSSPDVSAPPLAEANPSVPASLSSVVEKMMAKDPAKRYADVEALGRDIRASFSRPGRDTAERPAPISPGDSAELSVPPTGAVPSPQEALTASIPKTSMSLGKKLAYVASIMGLVVVVLVFLLVRSYLQRDMVRRDAQQAYDQALVDYREAAKAPSRAVKQAKFGEAGAAFGRIAKRYGEQAPNTASKAEVMSWLTTAQLGVLENNSNSVDMYWSKASDRNVDIQRNAHGELYKWTQDMKDQLKEFSDYYMQQRDYQKRLEAAKAGIASGNLAQALTEAEEAGKKALLTEQFDEVKALTAKIQEMQKQSEYLGHLQKADQAMTENKPDEAMIECEKALAVVESERQSLSPEVYQQLKQTAEQKKAELKVGIEYGKAIAEAETALSQNQMMAAADAYDKALKLKSTPELAEKVKDLRYNYNLEQGRQHMTTGQVELALDEFNKAKECRDTPEVQAELAEASKLKDYQGLTQAGDKLLAEKKFDDAIEKYHAAAGVRPGDEIKAKLADAQYAKAMYEGDQAVAAKDWAKAEASYRRADAARPNTPEARARIEQVQLEKKYSDLMNQAEAARAKGNYGEALNRLTAAKNVLDKPEVRERINEVKYQDNLQRGKQELADQNYVQALAYFKLARSFRQTPEVEKLIEDASKRPQ